MEQGMHYACQRCGNCCKWHGEVPVGERELAEISEFLELPLYDFIAEYTEVRLNRSGLTISEKENGECIFLEGNSCRINPVKPEQCAGFPNHWNFKGWRDKCEAIAVPEGENTSGE